MALKTEFIFFLIYFVKHKNLNQTLQELAKLQSEDYMTVVIVQTITPLLVVVH